MSWPPLREIQAEVLRCDYNKLVSHDADWRETALGALPVKQLCAVGAVARAEIEWCEGAAALGWTGMFSGRSTGVGLLRISTACVPPNNASVRRVVSGLGLGSGGLGGIAGALLFPCAAFKFPRRGMPSANLLFAGKKRGQTSPHIFAEPMCTAIKEKASSLPLRYRYTLAVTFLPFQGGHPTFTRELTRVHRIARWLHGTVTQPSLRWHRPRRLA